MGFAIVTPNGKYHGHVESPDKAAGYPEKLKEHGAARLLTEAEWQQVAANPDKRAELCGTLGKAI